MNAAIRCSLCEGEPRPAFEKHGILIYDCPRCGHRFAHAPATHAHHVEHTYDDQYFMGGGAGYPNYLEGSELLVAHGRRYGRLLRRYAPAGRLLDVGAAAGFVLAGLRSEGWDGYGVEPNARMADYACATLRIPVAASAFEDYRPDLLFDVLTLVQVMAHFVDPTKAVARVYDLLVPGGICLVETWNVRSWTARLLGQRWHEYSPPSVLQWFAPMTLDRLFESRGFARIARGRPSKWIMVRHAQSLLAHKAQESVTARLLTAVLKAIPGGLQIPYPAEDLFWTLYRKR